MKGDEGVTLNFDVNDPALHDAEGSFSTDHSETSTELGGGTLTTSTDTGVWGNYDVGADAGVEDDGTNYARAQGSAEIGAGWQGGVGYENGNFNANVEVEVGPNAGVNGAAGAEYNPETGQFSVEAQGSAEATVLDAEASAGFHTENNDLAVDVNAEARAGGWAEGSAGISNTGVTGEGEVFAGVEATAGGETSILDDTAKGSGEVGVTAGIGVGAGGSAGLEDGHLKFGIEGQLTLGVGLEFELNADIDLNKVADGVEDAGEFVADNADVVADAAADAAAEAERVAAEALAETERLAAEAAAEAERLAAEALAETERLAAEAAAEAERLAAEAAETVVDVAEDVGEGIEDGVEAVGDFFGF